MISIYKTSSFEKLWVVPLFMLLLSLCFPSRGSAEGLIDLDEIEFWAGSGSNRAAMIIDWNDGKDPVSLIWGYRWDGAASGEDMLTAICEADNRLFANLEHWDLFEEGGSRTVYGLGYDLDNDGDCTYVSGTGGELHHSNDDGYVTDADDHYKEGWMHAGYWSYYLSDDNGDTWEYSGLGMTSRKLADGDLDGWSFAPKGEGDLYGRNTPPDTPEVVSVDHSPFAVELVDFLGPYNAPEGAYSDPSALVGKPATYIKDGAGATSRIKLVEPAYIYGLEGEPLITTLNEGAFITVKFDHKVMDDPENPYGIDFLVFGNSFFTAVSGGWISDGTNMNEVDLSGAGWFERIKVSVSPDGENWYAYENGPYGDSLFPTQAYRWDPVNAQWVDEEMDWTRPVNPQLTGKDFAGKTAAEAIAMYNGSAGGTGYDLAESGFDWIQYIKVEGTYGTGGTSDGGEIDAFSDVAPLKPMAGDLYRDETLDMRDAILGARKLAGLDGDARQADATDIMKTLRILTGTN